MKKDEKKRRRGRRKKMNEWCGQLPRISCSLPPPPQQCLWPGQLPGPGLHQNQTREEPREGPPQRSGRTPKEEEQRLVSRNNKERERRRSTCDVKAGAGAEGGAVWCGCWIKGCFLKNPTDEKTPASSPLGGSLA